MAACFLCACAETDKGELSTMTDGDPPGIGGRMNSPKSLSVRPAAV
jgi:hypothetical protein